MVLIPIFLHNTMRLKSLNALCEVRFPEKLTNIEMSLFNEYSTDYDMLIQLRSLFMFLQSATNGIEVDSGRTFATSTASTKSAAFLSTVPRTKSNRYDPSNLTMATTSTTVTVIFKINATTLTSGTTRATMPPAKAELEKKNSLATKSGCWSMLIFLALSTFICQLATL
uniref:Uncharacterized protein n=1 Tax=Romanomermis culicivorax TaxID=13658 RepID=A0A915KSB7_ROMCU